MAATDLFLTRKLGVTSPATHIAAISPDDSNDLANVTTGILASAACTVKLTTSGGETVTSFPMQAGYNPIRVARVFSTGTTLSGATLWALW